MTSRELLAIALKIDTMRKLERQVRRLNTLACEVELTPAQKKRRNRLEDQYRLLGSSFGLFTEVQRDPRGAALKLHDSIADIESGMGVTL